MEHERNGLCTICREPVPAEEIFREGKVFIRKHCPECGPSESLISNDFTAWQRKRDIWHYDPNKVDSCSLQCRNCTISHTPTVAFVDVTNRCNMNCPICIANIRGMGFEFNPPMEYFDLLFQELSKHKPTPMIMMFGGEPTLRDDILDLVKLARRYGMKSKLVTNGLRFADEEYCRKMCEEGVRVLFALDGTRPEIYSRLRKNPGAYEKKMRALSNLKKYTRRKHTILCCAARRINDQYMGELIDYCHENAEMIDTLGLIPLTENWEPGEFMADVNTTREDAERMIEQSVPGGQVDFVPAGITHYLARARSFFRPKSTSEHLILGGVHPDCETITLLVSDGQQYRSANYYLRIPLRTLAEEILKLSNALENKLAKLKTSKFLHRLLGQYLVVKTFAPLALRAIDFKALFKGHPILNSLCILMGRLRGIRGRDLSYRYLNVPRVLRVVIFPFEEYHSLDSAKLRNCRAVFAYEDVETGMAKTIPACAWNTHRNELLRKIADKYNQSVCRADSVECETGV